MHVVARLGEADSPHLLYCIALSYYLYNLRSVGLYNLQCL